MRIFTGIIATSAAAGAFALAALRAPTKATPWILACIALILAVQTWRGDK